MKRPSVNIIVQRLTERTDMWLRRIAKLRQAGEHPYRINSVELDAVHDILDMGNVEIFATARSRMSLAKKEKRIRPIAGAISEQLDRIDVL